MPIETKDLVFYHAERDTDNPDGGGKYNGQVVADGLSNNLFKDISETDRTVGDVSMRKVYSAVTTEDTDTLMGATVFISQLPKDPNVSALLFSTESHTDERQAAQNRVENYLAKGGQIAGTPLDTHWQGMSLLQVAMFQNEVESNVGDTIVLISNEGKTSEFEQYLRITKVETRLATIMVDGQAVQYKIATYTLNDALERDFVGLSAKQWYSNEKSTTIIRDTLVADTGQYYSSVPLASSAQVGDSTVMVSDIFTQLIPSAQAETPILDVNAVGESIALVAGNTQPISVRHQTVISTSQNLYIGSSVMPGSLSFSLFGQTITDNGGLLKNSSGTQVATIDYQRGLIQWTTAAGSGNATLDFVFIPAAAPVLYQHSYSFPVTQNNQSSNWTGILVPIPAPGTLSISYMSQGKFYELKDNGSGQLKGLNPSFGSGMINYETGSWLMTTGALADVDSPIIAHWATPVATYQRADLPVLPAKIPFELSNQGLDVAGFEVTWMLEGVQKTATCNAQGQFTGDATGFISLSLGLGELIPNELPQKGTMLTFNYNFGEKKEQTISSVIPNSSQQLAFNIGTGSALQPGSIVLEVPLSSMLGDTATIILVDDAQGNLVDAWGHKQGTINYTTGAVLCTPEIQSSYFYENQAQVQSSGLTILSAKVNAGASVSKPSAQANVSTTYKASSNPWAGYVGV